MSVILTLEGYAPIERKQQIEILQEGTVSGGIHWEVRNQIKPVDLYCYLYARYGAPNGLQTMLRRDDSDNLIHWDWVLRGRKGLITFMGMNFRSEIHLTGDFETREYDLDQFLQYLKNDFGTYGKRMKEIRSSLENWDIFINPYYIVRDALERIMSELSSLKLDPEKERLENPTTGSEGKKWEREWGALSERYTRGFALAISARMLLPVMVESFVNLLIFMLRRPELKKDERLYNNYVRQPIDVRIKTVHLNCIGFTKEVDWSSEPCRNYNSIINDRNDLLHGNVNLEKLKFDKVYFSGTMPIFSEYGTFWKQSLGTHIQVTQMEDIPKLFEHAKAFIE